MIVALIRIQVSIINLSDGNPFSLNYFRLVKPRDNISFRKKTLNVFLLFGTVLFDIDSLLSYFSYVSLFFVMIFQFASKFLETHSTQSVYLFFIFKKDQRWKAFNVVILGHCLLRKLVKKNYFWIIAFDFGSLYLSRSLLRRYSV